MLRPLRTSRLVSTAYPIVGRYIPCVPSAQRRRLTTFEAISEGFLDLAIALPYPEICPPYATTIIVVAIASRLLFTVPVSIWAKRREWRMEDIVVPQLERIKPDIYAKVLRQMQQERVSGTKESIKGEHARRSAKEILELQKELVSIHNCKPWPTALAPLASQLPLFIAITYMLRYLSMDPTPFDSESFLSLGSLANPDATFALPIALGIITLANVESYKWFQTEAQREQVQKYKSMAQKKRSEGQIVIPWRGILHTGMRLATPIRMIIAGLMPGSVVVYWISSATFGLVQNWFLDWWHRWRKRPWVLENSPTSNIKS